MSTKMTSGGDNRPELEDLEGENEWTQLARKHWAKPVKTRKVKPDVIKKEIWDVLEKEGFQFRSLLILESLQLLEKSVHSFSSPISRLADNTQLSLAWLHGIFDQSPCPPDFVHRDCEESREPSCLGYCDSNPGQPPTSDIP